MAPTKSRPLGGWDCGLKQEQHLSWYNDDVQAVKKKERCCSLVNRDLPSTVPKTPSLYLILRYPVPGGFFLVSFPWYSPFVEEGYFQCRRADKKNPMGKPGDDNGKKYI